MEQCRHRAGDQVQDACGVKRREQRSEVRRADSDFCARPEFIAGARVLGLPAAVALRHLRQGPPAGVGTDQDPRLTVGLAATLVPTAVEAFGWDSLIFGSNWSVAPAVTDYLEWVDRLQRLRAGE